MAYAHIQNGTGSRTRTIRPLPEAWVCTCGRANAKHWNKCPDCKVDRQRSDNL